MSYLNFYIKKVTLLKGHSLVVLEGFEPSQAEPESDVLPLHHRTIPNCDCKGTAFFVTTKKKINFFSIFLIFSCFSKYPTLLKPHSGGRFDGRNDVACA